MGLVVPLTPRRVQHILGLGGQVHLVRSELRRGEQLAWWCSREVLRVSHRRNRVGRCAGRRVGRRALVAGLRAPRRAGRQQGGQRQPDRDAAHHSRGRAQVGGIDLVAVPVGGQRPLQGVGGLLQLHRTRRQRPQQRAWLLADRPLPDFLRSVDTDRVETRRRDVGQPTGLVHQVSHSLATCRKAVIACGAWSRSSWKCCAESPRIERQVLYRRRPSDRRMDQPVQVLGHPTGWRSEHRTHRAHSTCVLPLPARQRPAESATARHLRWRPASGIHRPRSLLVCRERHPVSPAAHKS